MDFMVDGLATGRMVRILSVVDAYTRECVALEADTSLGSGRVTRVLERLIEQRGRPEAMRSDNGPEFCSRHMLGWAEEHTVALVHIQPGPTNAEWSCRELPQGCAMSAHWFRTLNDVRSTLATWREEYDCERPHSSLDYRTPQEFRQTLEGSRPWPCSLPKLQPSTQPRISSYDWMRNRGQVTGSQVFFGLCGNPSLFRQRTISRKHIETMKVPDQRIDSRRRIEAGYQKALI